MAIALRRVRLPRPRSSVAPSSLRRAVTALLVGAAAGAVLAAVVPRQRSGGIRQALRDGSGDAAPS